MEGRHVPQWTQQDRLRKAREDAGLDQGELGALVGIGRTTIGNYERGVTVAKRPVLLAWSMATGVPLEWLRDGDNERPRTDLNRRPSDYKVADSNTHTNQRRLRVIPTPAAAQSAAA